VGDPINGTDRRGLYVDDDGGDGTDDGGDGSCDPTDPDGGCYDPASIPGNSCYGNYFVATGQASGANCQDDSGNNDEASPSCGNASKQAFVQANFAGAAAAATTLNINNAAGIADILTLSANESGWGTFKGGFPGAWFGMQGVVGKPLYQGETACAPIPGQTKFCEMKFSSFAAAAAVFAKNKKQYFNGVSDPTQFFTNAYTKAGFAQGSTLQSYLNGSNGTGGILSTEAWVQSCLQTLGLVP
jgi:hypothetical protein